MVTPEDYPLVAEKAGREAVWPPDAVARLYAGYEKTKRAAGVLDFDDLLLLTAGGAENFAER
jgi:DNA helicase-2/ATP-dependent DNA helicase PcrA